MANGSDQLPADAGPGDCHDNPAQSSDAAGSAEAGVIPLATHSDVVSGALVDTDGVDLRGSYILAPASDTFGIARRYVTSVVSG